MEEIDITKHEGYNKDSHHSHGRRFNLLPIILIGVIVFILFKTDIKSFFESEQFKKNTNYIKTSITNIWDKYSTQVKMDFFKAPTTVNTDNATSSSFSLKNFFPQIKNSSLQSAQIENDANTNNTENTEVENSTNTKTRGYYNSNIEEPYLR